VNFHASFFVFVLQRKTQGSCMSEHENKWYAKNMLDADAWGWNDLCKMQCWNMITDKCRNDMFIMMPWRDAYAIHDINAFMDTRARKIISSYLRIRRRSAPCVQLKRWYGPSSFSWKKKRPTYNACVMTWCRCTKVQQWDVHSMAISSNNHTTKVCMTFRLYAWQCLKGTQRVHFVPLF